MRIVFLVYKNKNIKIKNHVASKLLETTWFFLVDVNGLEPLTLRTSSVICILLQLLKQRSYAEKEQYRVAKNKTVAHKLHTKTI